MITLRVRTRGFGDLADDCRDGARTLDRAIAARWHTAANATVRRVKRNAETMPMRGYRTRSRVRFTARTPGGNIRKRMSAATEVEVSPARPHAVFTVHTDRLGNAANLPWHFEAGRVFRHPIMGRRTAWAGQSGKPWFYTQIRSDLDEFDDATDDGIDATIQRIERG